MGEGDLGLPAGEAGEFVTAGWLAQRLGRTQSNVRYLLSRGRLQGLRVQVGGRREWRIPRQVAEEYLAAEALRQGTRPPQQTDAVVVPLHAGLPPAGVPPSDAEGAGGVDVTQLRIDLAVARETEQLRAQVERLRAERDALAARVAGLEGRLAALIRAHADLAELHATLARQLTQGP